VRISASYVELNQQRDGMWHLQGKLTNTVGAQLNAILDPLTSRAHPASKTSTATSPKYRMPGHSGNGCMTGSMKPADDC